VRPQRVRVYMKREREQVLLVYLPTVRLPVHLSVIASALPRFISDLTTYRRACYHQARWGHF